MPSSPYAQERFTPEEIEILNHYFTNADLPVFGLKNLPEVVKGALFARYSRSPKSIRRLFLDEFHRGQDGIQLPADSESTMGTARAEQLYERIFNQYGDDSVAQLGGAHIACENVSNIATKVLERGRLSAYLEQSTRYIRYDQKVDGAYRYTTPAEIEDSQAHDSYRTTMELLFDTYADLVADLVPWLERRFPKRADDSLGVWRATINAKACDIARGLLPASTVSNLGIFANGQAFELMLIRMFAHPLQEVRDYAEMMLVELRKMIPSFMKRVDEETRGRLWSRYLSNARTAMADTAAKSDLLMRPADEVTLVDWDRDRGEDKIAAAALYEAGHAADADLLAFVGTLSEDEKDRIFQGYLGNRTNRRHKPGRAFERISYRFDILSDYGGFRDLQRHRMLTIEWQRLTTKHGYVMPDEVAELGDHQSRWRQAMDAAAETHELIRRSVGEQVAQYVVPFAYRVRFMMQMNAREAFHLIELRSQRQGHPNYRRICQEMHRQIGEVAGHLRVARAMKFVDYEEYDLERLESERRSASRVGQAMDAVDG
jgi:thymidylate synthase ThyX